MYEYYIAKEDDALKHLDGFDYWNNEEEEKQKEFDIRDGDFDKLEDYIRKEGLLENIESAIEHSGLKKKKSIVGVELAGGVCWTAPILFNNLDIRRMDYLEYSRHRIELIAPLILEHYGIAEDKVRLFRGSFYETDFDDKSYDFVVLCQALHHAEHIGDLLKEVGRILKDDGVVIVVGEPKIGFLNTIKQLARVFILSILRPNDEAVKLYRQDYCLYHDKVLGDRHYSNQGYRKICRRLGYNIYRLNAKDSRSYILRKRE